MNAQVWILLSVFLTAGACRPPPPKEANSSPQRQAVPSSEAAKSSGVQNPHGKDVLVRFSAGQDYAFEAAVAPCRESRNCPVVVRLLEESEIVDSAELTWPSATREMARVEPDPHAGAGDALLPEPDTLVWQSGSDAFYLTIAIRPVRLEGGRTGLLVSQRAGSDHPKRRHELFVHDESKLLKAWSVEEPSGPTWSATNVIRGNQGTDRVLYYYGRRSDGSRADSVGVWVVQWDEQSRKASRLDNVWPAGVFVAQFATFPAIRQAQAARDKLSNCLDLIWVLRASDYRVNDGKGYFIGGLTSNPGLLSALEAKAKGCDSKLRPSVVPYQKR